MTDPMPDRSMDHRDKIAWMVEQQGWAIDAVPASSSVDPPTPGYTYTVGLEAAYGFPEIVVFGLTPVAARGLLGLVVDLIAGGTEIPLGVVFAGLLDNDLRSALLPVDVGELGDLFPSATDWYGGPDYRMVQLCWPDRQGWLPWEPGYEHRMRLAQPVLGSLDDVE